MTLECTSKYVSIDTTYARPERKLDLVAFGTDIAKALGGRREPYEHDHTFYVRVGAVLVSLSGMWNKRDRVRVSISDPACKLTYGELPRGDDYQLPSITISVERPLTAIAADIKRRVIEAAAAPLAKRREHANKRAAENEQLKGVARHLGGLGLSISLKDGDCYSGGFHRHGDDGLYLSGRFYADGTVSIDRIGGLKGPAFDRVVRAIYGR